MLEILMLGRDGTFRISNWGLEDIRDTAGAWRLLRERGWDGTGMRAGAGREVRGTRRDCLCTPTLFGPPAS